MSEAAEWNIAADELSDACAKYRQHVSRDACASRQACSLSLCLALVQGQCWLLSPFPLSFECRLGGFCFCGFHPKRLL